MDESVVKHLERPQVGTLKLSEAIRIGARMRPQCTGTFFSVGKSCAIGAAMDALGLKRFSEEYKDKNVCWPYNDAAKRFGVSLSMMEEIYGKNDSGQSREQIADWLESIGY